MADNKKTVIIGAGQGGNSILHLLDKNLELEQNSELKKKVDLVYVNLNLKDLQDRLIDLKTSTNRFFYLVEKQGTGREIREGIRMFQEDAKRFDGFVKLVVDPYKYSDVIVIATAGGGTGSSFTSYFFEKILEIQDTLQQPIRITFIVVYPFIDEPINFHSNAFILTGNIINNMNKINRNKIDFTFIPVANTKLQEKTANITFEKINQYILQIVYSSAYTFLVSVPSGKEAFKTLDRAEYNKISNIAKVFFVNEDEIMRFKLENEYFFKKGVRLHLIKTTPSKKIDWYSNILNKIVPNSDVIVLVGEVNAPMIKTDYIIIVSNMFFNTPDELFSIIYETKLNYKNIVEKVKKLREKDKISYNKIDIDL